MPVGPISNGLYPRQTVCKERHYVDYHLKFSLTIQYQNVFHIHNAKNKILQVLARNLFLNDIHYLLHPGFKLKLFGFSSVGSGEVRLSEATPIHLGLLDANQPTAGIRY